MNSNEIYKKYFLDNQFERRDLFQSLQEKYHIQSALYPGSFAHITPSFYIPHVVYVDSDKQAKKFFQDEAGVSKIIAQNKIYTQEPSFRFLPLDYYKPLDLTEQSFDLLISSYAGFVSQPGKKYLKIGGILLANNSHGDAGLAKIDQDYELIGVVNGRQEKYTISEKNLDEYFIPKKQITLTRDYLEQLGKGVGYTKTANFYIFQRIA